MGGTRWSEDLAGEAILQFDCLAVDDHLLSPGRGPVAGTAISHILGKIKERDTKRERHKDQREKTPDVKAPTYAAACTWRYCCGRVITTALAG